MSKYNALWEWIKENGSDSFTLSFAEIEKIAGLPIDHSFLTYKKELSDYGYTVGKISLKTRTVSFEKNVRFPFAGMFLRQQFIPRESRFGNTGDNDR